MTPNDARLTDCEDALSDVETAYAQMEVELRRAIRTGAGEYFAVLRRLLPAIDEVALAGLAAGQEAEAWADGFRQGHRAAREAVQRLLAGSPFKDIP